MLKKGIPATGPRITAVDNVNVSYTPPITNFPPDNVQNFRKRDYGRDVSKQHGTLELHIKAKYQVDAKYMTVFQLLLFVTLYIYYSTTED